MSTYLVYDYINSKHTLNNHNTIHIKMNKNGLYIVNGSINNHPVKFLVDTGATFVVIPLSVAKYAKLTLGKTITAKTVKGLIKVHMTIANEIKIGNITLSNTDAIISPDYKEAYVLLGMSAIKKIELIHKRNQLILKKKITTKLLE